MNDVFQTGRRDGRMPFRVPEGFFDELPRRTVLRLRAETRRRRRRLIVRVAAVAVPFAACLAVAIVFRVSDGKGPGKCRFRVGRHRTVRLLFAGSF